MNGSLLSELKWRGLVDQITSDDLVELLDSSKLTFYIGFDPTAPSLHVGQLVVYNLMRILKSHGHQPIALIGGATGMIGDPSGKTAERVLMDNQQIVANCTKLQAQLEHLLNKAGGPDAISLNNYDWTADKTVLDFLRDIGKHFSVSQMIAKESVASRLTREGGGITFTEFSYMVLQANDFLHLRRNHDCQLQIGGSDQWGNIVAGIDLIRRIAAKKAYGLTMPLLVKNDGQKFGKSEAGTIWLDPKLTSPYKFYQFFLRQEDNDAIRLLKTLTTIDKETIDAVVRQMEEHPEKRSAQKLLAESLCEVVHSKQQLELCKNASEVIYGGQIKNLSAETINDIFDDVPSFKADRNKLEQGWEPSTMLVDIGACQSKSAARQLIKGGGFYVNNVVHKDFSKITKDNLIGGDLIVVRTGKKNYYLVKLGDN